MVGRGSLLGLILCAACAPPEAIGQDCHLHRGDLVISEIMANPNGSEDTEWIELYNATSEPLVLNRLALENWTHSKTYTHFVRAAGILPPRHYVVLGDGARNGVIDYSYDDDDRADGLGETFTSLGNAGAKIVVRCGDVVVDEVTYQEEKVQSGRSIAFDGSIAPDALLNDDSPNGAKALCPLMTVAIREPRASAIHRVVY